MADVMDIPKGFKQTSLGSIPIDWNLLIVKEYGAVKRGASSQYIKYVQMNGIRLIRINDFFENNKVFVESTDDIMRYAIHEDDILFAGTGSSAGASYIPKQEWVGLPHSYNVPRIRIKREYSKEFLLHALQSDYLRKQQRACFVGAAQPFLDTTAIENFTIISPPTKAEQTAIATVLTDADALITQLEKLIAKNRAIKQGAMQELLKPKEGWEVKKLKEVFKFLKTANNPRSDLMQDGEFEYIHYGDIHTRWNRFLDCSKNTLPFIANAKTKNFPFLHEGDLIIADASEDYEGLGACIEIKNIGIRKIVAGLHTMLLRGDKEILIDGFKGYLRDFHGVKEALIASSTGVSVYGISKSKLKNIEITIPSNKTEQTRIARILSDMDAEIEALERKLEKYKRIKQGMMQALLTGKIRLM